MDWLPLQINVRHRPCLIVGGGEVAARKCEWLLRAGAKVILIAPRLHSILQERLDRKEIVYHAGEFAEHAALILDSVLVIAATNQPEVNREISFQAKRQGVWVNVVDNSHESSVIFPAVIDRSPITVAVGSSGQSPVLARLIKAQIERQLPTNLGMFASLLAQCRPRLLAAIPTRDQRQTFVEGLVEAFLAGRIADSLQPEIINQALNQAIEKCSSPVGKVFIVGAGPGDPDLLTLKAHRLLQNADVVLYDQLVSAEILEYIRRDAQKISVGKRSGHHSCEQTAIHQQMLSHAQAGLQVVRLKGGDPALFSRLGEEIEFLSAHRIPYEVIPGITAALGCAAAIKIPLTHRSLANGCCLVTAHSCRDQGIDWRTLAANQDKTLVFYMGVKAVKEISAQLIAAGLPETTPMALVVDGTRRQQQLFVGAMADLPKQIDGMSFDGPGLILVGSVLRLIPSKNEEPIYGG